MRDVESAVPKWWPQLKQVALQKTTVLIAVSEVSEIKAEALASLMEVPCRSVTSDCWSTVKWGDAHLPKAHAWPH